MQEVVYGKTNDTRSAEYPDTVMHFILTEGVLVLNAS